MAFLCSHIHLTSITLSLGDFVGKNTSVILGWCFDNASLVFLLLREVIQAHRDYWHKTRRHTKVDKQNGEDENENDVPDLEIYIMILGCFVHLGDITDL